MFALAFASKISTIIIWMGVNNGYCCAEFCNFCIKSIVHGQKEKFSTETNLVTHAPIWVYLDN